jgi:hypothetical protein
MKFNKLHRQYLKENKLDAFKSFRQNTKKEQIKEAIWDTVDDPVIHWVSDNVIHIYNVHDRGYMKGNPVDVQMHNLKREIEKLGFKVKSWDIQKFNKDDIWHVILANPEDIFTDYRAVITLET